MTELRLTIIPTQVCILEERASVCVCVWRSSSVGVYDYLFQVDRTLVSSRDAETLPDKLMLHATCTHRRARGWSGSICRVLVALSRSMTRFGHPSREARELQRKETEKGQSKRHREQPYTQGWAELQRKARTSDLPNRNVTFSLVGSRALQ